MFDENVLTLIHSAGINLHVLEKNFPGEEPVKLAQMLQFLEKEGINDFIRNSKKILIVVNDHHRPTPTAYILQSFMQNLAQSNFKFLVATGTHKYPEQEQLTSIFGEYYQKYKSEIIIHNCDDASELKIVGKTSRNTPVEVNRHFLEADGVLIITSVEPHYFAGFTGGRKSIIPGISGRKTIENNHSLAMSPNSRVLRLEGNPVNDDMEEALLLFKDKNIFSVNTILNNRNQVVDMYAGSINTSFISAVEAAQKRYACEINKRYDIVLAEVEEPFNKTLYQSQKGIENSKHVLSRDGILILKSECSEGIGISHFYEYLKELVKSGDADAQRKYQLGDHKAYKLAELIRRKKLIVISDTLKKSLEETGVPVYPDLESTLRPLLANRKDLNNLLVVPRAATLVPVLKSP